MAFQHDLLVKGVKLCHQGVVSLRLKEQFSNQMVSKWHIKTLPNGELHAMTLHSS